MENDHTSEEVIKAFIGLFQEITSVLGFSLEEKHTLDEEVEALIEKRNEARRNRDFALSDQIRDQFKEHEYCVGGHSSRYSLEKRRIGNVEF
ncbi:hypothetical protein BsIDN1_01900 [Bacillus safensis]|uniref:Cysteinyl-tRNA ligase anticodon binding domain-containing protein n=1 Tax=Bacillus safensis TaxID=561879 RepID=A0A5S9M1G9_BACIA|nr:hypothetical protein BsIDN1_01900 [Bacillus safensis]